MALLCMEYTVEKIHTFQEDFLGMEIQYSLYFVACMKIDISYY